MLIATLTVVLGSQLGCVAQKNDEQNELQLIAAEPVHPVAVSPDGRFLAAGGMVKGDIYLWDLRTLKLVRKWRAHLPRQVENSRNGFEGTAVVRLVFSPDNRLLGSYGADGKLLVWNLKSERKVASVDLPSSGHFQFAPNSQQIWGCEYKLPKGGDLSQKEQLNQTTSTIFFCDIGRSTLRVITMKRTSIVSLTFLNNTNIVTAHNEEVPLMIGAEKLKRPSIRAWDLSAANPIEIEGRRLGVGAIIYSAAGTSDGKFFATSNYFGQIEMWDLTKKKITWKTAGSNTLHARSLVLSADGKILGAFDGIQLQFWKIANKEAFCRIPFESKTIIGSPNQFTLAPDGSVVWVTDEEATIRGISVRGK